MHVASLHPSDVPDKCQRERQAPWSPAQAEVDAGAPCCLFYGFFAGHLVNE